MGCIVYMKTMQAAREGYFRTKKGGLVTLPKRIRME